MTTYHSYSLDHTSSLSARLVTLIEKQAPRHKAAVVLLMGDLGSGKTTLVRAMAQKLGSRARVVSPTFVLMRSIPLKHKRFRKLYHLDCYRLKSKDHLKILNLTELLQDESNLICVEWSQNVPGAFARPTLRIKARPGKQENERVYQY